MAIEVHLEIRKLKERIGKLEAEVAKLKEAQA